MAYAIRRLTQDRGEPDTSTVSGYILQALRDWRAEGNSIFGMAKEIGISRERLYCYANGRKPIIGTELQDRIAKYLGIHCCLERDHGGRTAGSVGSAARRSAKKDTVAAGAAGKESNGHGGQASQARRGVPKARKRNARRVG
jgi:hypothetical protein